jgi:uncharacterized SAM-binding protein YcdF (DUF218 family)
VRTVLFIHGGKVLNGEPTAHFLVRTRSALAYYDAHHASEDIIFLVAGRWLSVTETFPLTEAEIGKQYILKALPEAVVIKEDISVDLIGNYAFSKPLIASLAPDKTIGFTTELLRDRTELILKKVFGAGRLPEINYLADEVTYRPNNAEREAQAASLFKNLFADVKDGDDAAVRETLLYSTPYYFKNLIDDKTFFDRYWSGGYDSYLRSRTFYKT